jgi:hypothetical protein
VGARFGVWKPRKLSVQSVAGKDSFQSSPAYNQKYYRWTKLLGYICGGMMIVAMLILMKRIRRRKALLLSRISEAVDVIFRSQLFHKHDVT